ncbi:MAG: ParA family protein [Cyanothece sp. SIO1E1]|nr:ParA family protein [Cyanothece sp. SIO1E1]
MTRIISLFNQAGGVGKSTLTMNLGYHLSTKKRVLLVDTDPQASLTVFMGIVPSELETTIKDSIIEQEPLPIHGPIHGMDIVPSNILLSAAERQLTSTLRPEMRLKTALAEVQDQYDFILIDSPPSLGMLSTLGLVAAQYVLIPSQTQFKSTQGTDLVLNTIAEIRKVLEHDLQIAGLVPTLFAKGTLQDQEALGFLKDQLSQITKVYPPIPRATAFADAVQEGEPLAVYSPSHAAVSTLKKIARDLEKLK